MVEAAGFEPRSTVSFGAAESQQNSAKSRQISALPDSANPSREQTHSFPEQNQDNNPHPKCATCVQQDRSELPDDLSELVTAWSHLTEVVRAGILAMVQAAVQDKEER
jgi:hypothetical protein